MERIHGRLGAIVRGARCGLPWLGLLALSTSLASAVTFALASTPAPEPSTALTLTTATAALADGDEVRASFLAGLTVGDGRPRHFDRFANSAACAEPNVTPCAEGGS